MTLPLRHRAALVLTGALISAPLWGMAIANASGSTVTFSGQPLLGGTLSCPSSPSQGSMSVAPGTQVDFVNKLGRSATLWAGSSQMHLPNKSLVPVTFNHGPAQVKMQMLPDCDLDLGTHAQMTVNVTAPAPPAGGVGTHPVPVTPPADIGEPPVITRSGEPTTAPKATPTQTATDGPSAIAPSAMDSSGGTGGTNAAPIPLGTSTDGSDDDPFATPASASNVVVGEPIGPSDQPNGASGLLTLIAVVGVVGVSAAAIRAIIAQRASQALAA